MIYGLKILLPLLVLVLLARALMSPGLRKLMPEPTLRTLWLGLGGTCVVVCMGGGPGMYFMLLAAWALWLAHRVGPGLAGRLPTYALMLPILPPVTLPLTGLPGINYVLTLSGPRVLALTLLVPAAVHLWSKARSAPRPGWLLWCDVATLVYATLWISIRYGAMSGSVILRQCTELGLDTLLPYYVLSRGAVDGALRRQMLGFFLAAACFQGVVAITETATGHLFYTQLQWVHGTQWQLVQQLMRGSWLRAQGAYGGPLTLAVLLQFALGTWAMLRPAERSRAYDLLGLLLLGGLIATFGRGPWLSALLMAGSLWLLRRMAGRPYLLAMAVLGVAIGVLQAAGLGQQMVSFFSRLFGSTEGGDFNVQYRQELLDTSIALLRQSPWWGVNNAMQQMQHLRQGEGIIDLVNTYLVVALAVGLIGLSIYLLPFLITLWQQAGRHDKGDPVLGREMPVALAQTVAMLAVVFTISPISIVEPLLVWCVALTLARLQETPAPPGVRLRR